MKRKQNPNLSILTQAVERLGELSDEMVFLGGCATGLLITDKAAPPLLSHDIEDMIAVLDGRPEIVDEVQTADQELIENVRARFTQLLGDSRFIAALSGHMPGDQASQARVGLVIDRIEAIVKQ